MKTDEPVEDLGIAVIGMSARFPGADNIDQFWRNLRDGVESIRRFTDEELKGFGVNSAKLGDPRFVKAGAILDEIDKFDAAFFGYSPREAEILDPQQRIFLECAWQAMEDAGYSSDAQQNLVGVFAGTSLSTYLLYNLFGEQDSQDTFQTMIANDKDFLCSRVSYELNLKGPSIDIQTACSTSLVAVHMACQSLLSYQCDIALAGGISVQVPQLTGYYFIPGGISSPDGHCRAFDVQSQGTVFGSGVGIIALKRLADALSDRDTIHAIIKGTAVSNDGSSKIGYTAPSIEGQAQAIAMAQIVSEVDAETITYVETHGTGTALGDPVEVAALTKAFRANTSKNNFCAIGSVKSNIGHLDAAAGIAGLIKTVLALKHRQLPPSLHFERPNPQIDFANSPFYVNSRLQEWRGDGSKLRAGVSSFGVGGTNAHVVLEESPESEPGGASREYQLIALSARSASALETASGNLARRIREDGEIELADVAYTLQVGRKRMSHRRTVVCRDKGEAARLLESKEPGRVLTVFEEAEGRSVVLMFPGGGAQYVNMGLGLYQSEKVFRREVDRCSEILKEEMGYDIRECLYPGSCEEEARRLMRRTRVGLPALFAVEYAMAKQLESWGIKCEAMIGHSLGEYVAACLAGVFRLEDALKIVRVRGELFEELPRGGMVSVEAGEEEVRTMIWEELSVAAVNGPEQVVVSGEEGAIEKLCERMRRGGIEHRRVQIEVAAHSHLVDGILDRYEECVKSVKLVEPVKRYISNVSGKWVKGEEAKDAGYWRRQLRECVRFSDGVKELRETGAGVMLEVGPGQTMRSLVKAQTGYGVGEWVVGTMRHPQEEKDDREYVTEAIGKLWMAGVDVDWEKYYEGEKRRRVGLPTYPFERQRYWIEARGRAEERARGRTVGKNEDVGEWFYIPGWQTKELRWSGSLAGQSSEKKKTYIVMEGESSLGRRLTERLMAEAADVIRVRAGASYSKLSEREYEVRATEKQDYEELLEDVMSSGAVMIEVVHLWSIGEGWAGLEGASPEQKFSCEQRRGFYSLLSLAQAFARLNVTDPIKIDIICDKLHQLNGEEGFSPEKSTLMAFCKVIPQEAPNVSCYSIDVVPPPPGSREEVRLVERLITELNTESQDVVIAYRANRRWVQSFEQLRLERCSRPARPLRVNGVYLITGGLGGVGLLLAEYLARTLHAKLILTGRSFFPEKSDWASWLESHGDDDEIGFKIRRLQAMEAAGADIVVASVDVADEERMNALLNSTLRRFGVLHGVLHTAGITSGPSVFKPFTEISLAETESQFRPKGYGLYVLEKILRNIEIDFCLLFSSNASVLGGLGLAAYSAANTFMDAFALSRHIANQAPWISATWDAWPEETKRYAGYQTSIDQYTMTAEESIDAFSRLVTLAPEGQLIVSTGDFYGRLDLWISRRSLKRDPQSIDKSSIHPRPNIGSHYVAPRNDDERTIAEIWQQLLGLELVGVHDDFFSLGGQSLLATKVVGRLGDVFQVELPIRKFFQSPTVAGLAQAISDLQAEQKEQEKNELLEILSQLSDKEVESEIERQKIAGL